MSSQKQSPSNSEAELAIVGAAFLHGDSAVIAANGLRDDEFYFPAHREAWKAILACVDRSGICDPITVGEELRAQGLSARFPVAFEEWAMAAATKAPIVQLVAGYARIVRETAASRKLIELCLSVMSGVNSGLSWDEQIAMAREGVAGLEDLSTDSGTKHVSSAILECTGEIERRQNGEKIVTVDTGISTVDEILGGLRGGQLVVVAARPGVGKSALACNIAAINGLRGIPVLMFSVEMVAHELGVRWLSWASKIDGAKINRGDVDVGGWHKLMAEAENFKGATLWFNDTASKLTQIIAEARRWHARHVRGKSDRGIILIDYAQRITIGREKGDTREQEVAKVPVACKSLARYLGVPVVLVAQLSREVEKRGGEPMLSDLRESGAFEQEANIVLFPHHDGEKHKIIVAKNRGGETGWAPCRWVPELTAWMAATNENEDRWAERE